MTLTSKISNGLNKRKATIAVSLDFSKAFDTVWQEGIVYKMHMKYAFNKESTRMIKNYLNNRSCFVALDDHYSNIHAIKAGVPQGSVLGPVLYNLFIADIPEPSTGEFLSIFADDIMIAYTHYRAKTAQTKLNNYLRELTEFFNKWKLKLNLDKCRSIIFKGRPGSVCRNARKFIPSIKIENTIINNTNIIKYLGIVLQSDMQYTRHVDHVLQKGKYIYGSLRRTIGKRGGLSLKVKLLIYKQLVRPAISYAFPVWFSISSAQMERIRILERKMIKHCLGLKTFLNEEGRLTQPNCRKLYEDSNITRIDKYMTNIAINYLEKCTSHPNSNISELVINEEELLNIKRNGLYLTPMCLLTLHQSNQLFDNENKLMFYHRRYKTYNFDNTVYITTQ